MPKDFSSALILRFDAEQLGGRATEDQNLFGIAETPGLEDEIDRSIAASNGPHESGRVSNSPAISHLEFFPVDCVSHNAVAVVKRVSPDRQAIRGFAQLRPDVFRRGPRPGCQSDAGRIFRSLAGLSIRAETGGAPIRLVASG